MRLIDADALLEKVQFRTPIDNHNAEVIAGCVTITRRIIDNFPTIDAVPVVRCRECWNATKIGGFMGEVLYCPIWERNTDEECFCSYGERKDGEG